MVYIWVNKITIPSIIIYIYICDALPSVSLSWLHYHVRKNNNILRVLYFLTETTFPTKSPSWLWEIVPKKSQNRCSTLILYFSLLTLKWRICLEGRNETRNPRIKGREICSKLTEHSDGCQLEVETLQYLQQFSTPHPTPPPNNTYMGMVISRELLQYDLTSRSPRGSKNRIALTPQI